MTETYRKRKNTFFLLSMICWLGLCGFLLTYGLATNFAQSPESGSISEQIIDILMPIAVSYLIALVLFIFVREKLRNSIWIVNMVLAGTLLGTTMLYIAIGLFALDEFIFVPLYKKSKEKYTINKEIDKRG